MSRIEAIEEEDSRVKSSRITWADLHQSYCTQPDTSVHRKDLPPGAVDLLDRTEAAAQGAIAQTELASAGDQMRASVSKRLEDGAERVADIAQSGGIVTKTKIRSHFDLASEKNRDKDTEAMFRRHVKAVLEKEDPEAVQGLQELLSEISTKGSAKAPSLRPNAPELAPPRAIAGNNKFSYLRLVCKLNQSMEEVIADCGEHLDMQTKSASKELSRLSKEKIKAIEEHALEERNKDTWSSLASIARYITSVASIAFGAALIGTGAGATAGGFLISAGALGLINAAASDFGVWKSIASHFTQSQETAQRIAQGMEFATTLIALGLSTAGGFHSYQTTSLGAVWGANQTDNWKKAGESLTWLSVIFSATTTFGSKWCERKVNLVSGLLEKFSRQEFNIREHLKDLSQQTQQTIKMAQIISEEASRIIAAGQVDLSNH